MTDEPFPAKTKADQDLRRWANYSAILALVAVAVSAGSVVTALDIGSLSAGFTPTLLAERLLPQVPVIFYIFAALAARAILDRISDGEFFSARNISGVAELGSRMVWGAGLALFVIPSVLDWVHGIAGYRVDFRPETLIIATIGLCLLALGRLLLRAQKLEAEMEAII